MQRYDHNMPFLLKYENVAWFENGEVRILDRRIYPRKIQFVICKTYNEVAFAIKNMVTQSAGPYTALGMGMALAAYQARSLDKEKKIEFLKKADHILKNSRPTTKKRYSKITQRALGVGISAINNFKDPVKEIMDDNIRSINRRYKIMRKVGENLFNLIGENNSILTQCYGETIIGALIAISKEKSKSFKVYCAETRPFMQGARFTASCFAEEGFDTTVLTDNMIAYAMESGLVDIFTSAADCIAEDGCIINKIGTLQIAKLAKIYGIKYFVTGIPDKGIKNLKDVKIEMRDYREVLKANGILHTNPNVKAIYPSFDKVNSDLIDLIVTDRGAYQANKLLDYFKEDENIDFY